MSNGIKQLQDSLLRIGVLEGDYRQGELDEPTREAIRRVQHEGGLDRDEAQSGQPDAETVGLIESRAADSGRFVLRGWVRGGCGPLSKIRIDAYDRDVGDLRERLGEKEAYFTDDAGRFEIIYSAQQFAGGDKDTADIVLTMHRDRETLTATRILRLTERPDPIDAMLAQRRLLAGGDWGEDPLREEGAITRELVTDSELRLGIEVLPVQELVIEIGALSTHDEPSEYERLDREIAPLLRGLSPSTLDEERYGDLSFVAREISWPRERIEEFSEAWRASETTRQRPEVFYGLFRDGPPATLAALPTEVSALLMSGEQAWRAKLNDSIEQNFIPSALACEMEEVIAALKRGQIDLADQPMGRGRASLSAVLGMVGVLADSEMRARFLGLFQDHRGPMEEFWTQIVPEVLDWSPDDVAAVQLTLQLAELTGYNKPLMERVRDTHRPKALRDLVALDAANWLDKVRKTGFPSDDDAEEAADPAVRYVDQIVDTLRRAYPTHHIASLAMRSEDPEPIEARDLLANFFSQELDRGDETFNFGAHPVTPYLKAHGDRIFAHLDEKQRENLSNQLKRLQRLYQMTPDPKQFEGLLSLGLDSAYKVVHAASAEKFSEIYADRLGGTAAAAATYAKAIGIHQNVVLLFTELLQLGIGPNPAPLQSPEEQMQKVKQTATYRVRPCDDVVSRTML
jgi:hypothetical protein